MIARDGGRHVLATGACCCRQALSSLGLQQPSLVRLGWAVIGLGMSASLYDAAFSTLGQHLRGANHAAL